MTNFKQPNCYECGGVVFPLASKGRLTRHRNMELPVPRDLEIPTCENCGEEFLDDSLCDELNSSLEKTYLEEVQLRIRSSLKMLETSIPRHELENLLGLHRGHLLGAESPLVSNLLALIADDPDHNLEVLKRSWALRMSR